MKKNIKVGLDIRDLRIAKTGAKTYLEELSKEFRKGKPGFEFYFIDTFLPVYTGKNKFLKLLEQLRFLLYKQVYLPFLSCIKGCDVLICTDFFVPYFTPGFKAVPVFHDAFFWEYPTHYNKYWLFTFSKFCVPAAKKSLFIITPTEFAKQRILKFLAIDSSKIIAIAEAPKALGTYSDPLKDVRSYKYFLHIGVFEKRKNLVRLIEAFAQVRRSYPEFKLVLGGHFSPKHNMDDSSLVLQAIQAHDLQDAVILPGYLSNEQLKNLYSNAFAYVFPSINEGFGLPILEAFAHQIPVLIANNSSLPEVGGDAVLLFDPFDSTSIASRMTALIEDIALRSKLIQKGNERLKLFSWEQTADEILNTIKKTLY